MESANRGCRQRNRPGRPRHRQGALPSRDFNMFAPEVNTDGRLWLRTARHPLLEQLFRNEHVKVSEGDGKPPERKVVPIDVRLGIGFNQLVITGPNTGRTKTVTIKTTGLLAARWLCKRHAHTRPGEGSTVPVWSPDPGRLIGDEQSIEQSLSTFSSHISRIATIFTSADAKQPRFAR